MVLLQYLTQYVRMKYLDFKELKVKLNGNTHVVFDIFSHIHNA